MLKAISNLFERSEFLIWLLFLEKFQTLRLSYDRKPEPQTPDPRGRYKIRELKGEFALQILFLWYNLRDVNKM